MRIRYKGRDSEGGKPVIDRQIVNTDSGVEVNDYETVKYFIEKGVNFEYLDGDEWKELTVDYFEGDDDEEENEDHEEELKTETFTSDIEKVEEADYSDLFEGHWRTQVSEVKEYVGESVEELEEVIEYAKENDITDGVIDRLENYKQMLEE